jgi:hypothetical protein
VDADIPVIVSDGRPYNFPEVVLVPFLLIVFEFQQVVFYNFCDMMKNVYLSSVSFIGLYFTGAKLTHCL